MDVVDAVDFHDNMKRTAARTLRPTNTACDAQERCEYRQKPKFKMS
jgi:hypothetical protein